MIRDGRHNSDHGAVRVSTSELARMPRGDAIRLLLHRAGIGVDAEGDVGQLKAFSGAAKTDAISSISNNYMGAHCGRRTW